MRKVTYSILMFLLFLLFNNSQVHASEKPIIVFINGEQIHFDINPITKDYYTLVQFRPIFEKLNIQFKWNGSDNSITGNDQSSGTTFKLNINSKTVTVNGKAQQLPVAPELIKDSTFVPLRFVSETIGKDIGWDEATQTITITDKKPLSTEGIGKLGDRVVYIEANDKDGHVISTGSGIVISNDGKILTNYHVLEGSMSATVVFNDQKSYKTTKVMSYDTEKDLIVIKIDALDLPFVTIGDSSKLELGESVVAIGSPLGYKNSLTTGVVSSTFREVDNHDYIQISTPIDHGSSGGALFDMFGNVVGITSAGIQSQADINLAIPSNTVQKFLNKKELETDLVTVQKDNLKDNIDNFLNENYAKLIYEINGENLSFPFMFKTSQFGLDSISISMFTKNENTTDLLLNSYKEDSNILNNMMVNIALAVNDKFNINSINVVLRDSQNIKNLENGIVVQNDDVTISSSISDFVTKKFRYALFPEDENIMGTLDLK